MIRYALTLLWVAACNTAPLDYEDMGAADGADADWVGPTYDETCDEDPNAVMIDGHLYCNADNSIMPVDDPLMRDCDPEIMDDDVRVFYVFDGVDARAYPIQALKHRELVHDEYGDGPLLVDW